MSEVPIETSPEALIRRRFADAAVEIQSIERRDYPGESIFVVYVGDQQFETAAQLGNDLDSELEAIDFKGFVTVRKRQTSAESESLQVAKGVNDAHVNDFVSLISARSRTSEVQPSLSYVPDASNKILTATAPRHHLIFGRRGAGKTALMVEAKRVIESEGCFSVWVNLQTLRNESAAGAFLFICQRICDCVEVAYSQKQRVPHVLLTAIELREELEKLSSTAAVPEDKVNPLVPRMQLLIRRFLDSSATRLYLFLDELHYLPLTEQPRLLDLLHGSVRDCNAWLKIAGIKHLSRWFQTKPLLGLQTGHDADHIDLDITLENPTRAKIFLEEVLRSYIKHVGMFSLGGVFSPESLDRLVIASGAVPRDYLVLSAQAVRQAQRREKARLVGVQDVNRAAGDAAKIKIAELEDDAASAERPTNAILTGLHRVRSFCVDEKNFSYFRIDFRDKELRPVEYNIIEELMDLRLIHLLDPSVSDEREAGRRSEVYMLDLSQFSGERLKRRLKVLDFESGHLVQKETGTNRQAKVADTARQRLAILRRGPLFELELFRTSPADN